MNECIMKDGRASFMRNWRPLSIKNLFVTELFSDAKVFMIHQEYSI